MVTVKLEGPSEIATVWATVEAVPAPEVEFRAPEGAFDSQPGPMTVIVTPGSDDTVAAVPASAVVQLPPGPAVFVPLGQGRVEVRWVLTGPSVGGKVVVREGLKKGTSVVAHGLSPLVEGARDSLERRAGQSRHPTFILAFAAACGAASVYGFLTGTWPFGVVEAVWSLVAVRRWRSARRKKGA